MHHPKLGMHNISDARANVVVCELQQLQGSGTAGAEIQGFDTKPLCAVWEAHDSDVPREMALEIPSWQDGDSWALQPLRVFASC